MLTTTESIMTIDNEISFYKANRKEFVNLYENKFIIIKDCSVIGVYNTHTQAVNATVGLPTDSYIIEHPTRIMK